MRRLFGLLWFIASTASAAPVITSVTPSEGTEHGGTWITIRGTGFKNAKILIDGALPAAYGGDPAKFATEIGALTVAHAPGTVSVTVRQDDGELTLPNAFTYTVDPYHMSPMTGPASGGTLVTVKGQFLHSGYQVLFAGRPALQTWQISNDTLLAVSPPRTEISWATITIWENDYGIATNLVFKYEEAPERVLLPLLIPPVDGAFGSRFVTELRGFNRSATENARIYGLSQSCICSPPLHPDPQLDSIVRGPREPINFGDAVMNGTPGRFVFVPENQMDHLWLNLKVRDTSRSGENFGTELPVVRDRELFRNEPIVFTDVPTDTRFRNTLRVYADAAVKLRLEIARDEVDFIEVREIEIPAPANKFNPAYAQIGDLPVNAGPVRITITAPEPGQPGFYTAIWAFISVTNNDTQLITTIRP